MDAETSNISIQEAVEKIDGRIDLFEANEPRKRLKQSLILTVAKDSTGDFSTIQSALNYVEKDLDLNGFQVAIEISPGNYIKYRKVKFSGYSI